MAAGKPVIVSNRAGASEIVQNNVNGFVVSHGDSSEIAERVELFVKGRHLTEKLGNNGYHYVKKNLSWEKYAKSMEEIFKQTINSQQR
jgi:glycosyltransferase involved in cell wall biosynthesis